MMATLSPASIANYLDRNAMLQCAMICTVVLYFKTHYCFLQIGKYKLEAGKRAPEDTYQKHPLSDEAQTAADENLDRAQRIAMNDIENVFLGLIVIWVTALAPVFTVNEVAHIVLTVLFTVCRIMHTILYMNKISYGRSLAWFGGHLCIVGLFIDGLVGIFD